VSDIEPWLEDGAPAEIAEWLRAARAEEPSRRVVERSAALAAAAITATVGVASGAVLEGAAAGGGASGGKLGVLLLAKWGLAGVLAGSVVSGGSAYWNHVHVASSPRVLHEAPRPAAMGASPAVVAQRLAENPATLTPPANTEGPPAAPAAEKDGPSLPTPTARPRAAEAPSAEPDARMSAELRLLERAQASADAGQRGLALELLREHEQRFGPAAPLSPEARYLKLEVFAASGRMTEARAVAHEILARDPAGPHAGRARRLLEQEK